MPESLHPKLAGKLTRIVFVSAALMLFACAGRAQDGGPSSAGAEATAGWRTYVDKAYGFSIRYPETYVILREPKSQPVATPRVAHRVRFQDRQLASGQTADLEPPQFSIEVFEPSGSEPLRDWLQFAVHIGADDSVEPVHLDGAGEGLRVRNAMQLAPNDFYYFARGKYIFKLTPLGSHGEQMLNSFRFRLNR
jgi:hypothetical protein